MMYSDSVPSVFIMQDAGTVMMNDYDVLTDAHQNEFVESFLPCRNSGLANGLKILFESNYKKLCHPVIDYCSLTRKPYFTCVTYRQNVSCVSQHVCSFVPVIIGSKLDRLIVQHLYPEHQYNMHDIMHIYGTIFIDSSYYFSNLLTNRKELMHRVKRSNAPESYEMFIYDLDERGHKLSMDNSGKITYRNRSGKDEPLPFFNADRAAIDGVFKLDGNFLIEDENLMLHHMHSAFSRLYEHRIHIDSLANKNIMSPINMLQKAIQYSRRNNTDVAKFMKFGMIEKFASLQISYRSAGQSHHGPPISHVNVDASKFNMTTSVPAAAVVKKRKSNKVGSSSSSISNAKKPKNNGEASTISGGAGGGGGIQKKNKSHTSTTHESFNFKKIQPNQLGSICHTWYRHVVRPIPKNVPNIPIDTEFFLCMAEKSMSIDSPNRWMVLLDNIYISNHLHHATYDNINSLLTKCLAMGFFVELDPLQPIPSDCCVVMVNGGLLTRFALAANSDTDRLFFSLKSLNPFVEVYITTKFVMVNLTDGIAFLKIDLEDGTNMLVSPLELMSCMKKYRTLRKLDVLGPNCPTDIKKMIAYVSPSKLMSIVYLRNRFNNIDRLPLFPLTTDNTCAFIDYLRDGQRELYDGEHSLIRANVIFSSNPQLTADGYIMSNTIKSKVHLCKRYSIDFITNTDDTNFFWPTTSFQERTRNIYDSLGNVTSRRILVMEIVKFGKRLNYKVFPQIRLKLHERNLSANRVWSYTIEYWDDTCESFDEKFDLSVICTTVTGRRREKSIVVSVTAYYRDDNFDFKFSEMCGQKGIIVRKDTERYAKLHNLPQKPDIISSIFSVIGRSPLIQLKCIMRDRIDTSNQKCLFGPYNYGILKNVTSSVSSYNPMRIDWSLGKVLAFNNCCRTLYSMQQDALSDQYKGQILPPEAQRALALMGIIKCAIKLKDRFSNSRMSLMWMKREDILKISQ